MKVKWFGFELEHEKDYNTLGCSPKFLKKFREWLLGMKGNIDSLDLCLYLFNNEELYNLLKEIADYGCKVSVYSIPLEGYDDNFPAPIYSHKSHKKIGEKTKYNLAYSLYKKIKDETHQNFQLYIVPHMYVRSEKVQRFSRGKMPYSLHCKSFLLQMQDGTTYEGVTSSNFAVRDQGKHELAAVFQLKNQEISAAKDFYSGLFENSISISDFEDSNDYTHFKITMRSQPPKTWTMHIAPFYINSAPEFEKNIITMINKATENIYVCAQHISAYEYIYKDSQKKYISKEGFLSAVIEKANSGVPTKFLSQTYVDETGNSCGHRSPLNTRSFSEFIAAARRSSNCKYYVNDYVHCKFIVVDDIVIITTCNFTPTQFIYIDNVSISKFDNMPGLSYEGIHCEFGAYFVVKDQTFAQEMIKNFNIMIADSETCEMF